MKIDLAMLAEIVDTTRSTSTDKVYTGNEKMILLFASAGGKIIKNSEQKSGGWVTQIKVGSMTFIHISSKKIV
jgi:hypothetical protein